MTVTWPAVDAAGQVTGEYITRNGYIGCDDCKSKQETEDECAGR